MNYKDLIMRTKKLSVAVVNFCTKLKGDDGLRHIRLQLFRCGTSVGANYRAAIKSQSDAAFIAKLSIVIEEADEVSYWIEVLDECGYLSPTQKEDIQWIHEESQSLRNLFAASRKTLQNKNRKK